MSDVETAQTGAPVVPAQDPPKAEVTQVEGSESTTGQVDEPKQDDRPRDEKGRYVPQERVNEITRARREAERERDYLRQQLEYVQQQAPQPRTTSDAPPDINDYSDFNEWARANADYIRGEAARELQQQFVQQQDYARQAEVANHFESQAAAYAAENPGFDERFTSFAQAFQPRREMAEAIALSEHGPAVFDYLSQHWDEADRIFRMPLHLAAVQIGRIEERLSKPKSKPVTNAPTPAPVLGSGSTSQKDVSRMSDAEWLAHERMQKRTR